MNGIFDLSGLWHGRCASFQVAFSAKWQGNRSNIPMRKVRTGVEAVAAAGLIAAAIALPAKANVIYDSTIVINGQGFGSVPRILTLQTDGTESGCVASTGGTSFTTGSGSCIA